jgi:hypothetical protein
MKLSRVLTPSANYLGVLLLVAIILSPFYFAKNFTRLEMVAGVNTQALPASAVTTTAPFVLTFQTDKFPNLTFSRDGDNSKIGFTKVGPSQAFIAIANLQNPTGKPQSYTLQVATGSARLFFGTDIASQPTSQTVSANSSVPVSLFSGSEATAASQTIEFKIQD